MSGLINKVKEALHTDSGNTSTDNTGTSHGHRKLSDFFVQMLEDSRTDTDCLQESGHTTGTTGSGLTGDNTSSGLGHGKFAETNDLLCLGADILD